MRKKRPHVTTLSDVRISRKYETAIIEYKDKDVSTVHLTIGPQVTGMSDEEILEMHNQVLRVQSMMAAENKWVPIEIPSGRRQVKYQPEYSNYWSPRGGVLRCIISDGGPNCETTIIIDDHEFSMVEFGVLLQLYTGWGMRVVFVDEDKLEEQAEIKIREPNEEKE